MHFQKTVRIAILDLYAGQVNQGLRCIREILAKYGQAHHINFEIDEFEVRIGKQVPDLSYQIYISTGGPGSPLESEGEDWETVYFGWLNAVEAFNRSAAEAGCKHVLFICHSFELACRHYGIANVCRRKSISFGVFPVHLTGEGHQESIFEAMNDPFYAMDSRSFQVVQPNYERMKEIGASVLAIEKERPHVPLERCIMAVRYNKYMIGTQFHPEADALGTSKFLKRKDKKEAVIAEHGEEKWRNMIFQLSDPDKIRYTYAHIIPNFLKQAIHLHDSEPALDRR